MRELFGLHRLLASLLFDPEYGLYDDVVRWLGTGERGPDHRHLVDKSTVHGRRRLFLVQYETKVLPFGRYRTDSWLHDFAQFEAINHPWWSDTQVEAGVKWGSADLERRRAVAHLGTSTLWHPDASLLLFEQYSAEVPYWWREGHKVQWNKYLNVRNFYSEPHPSHLRHRILAIAHLQLWFILDWPGWQYC